MGEDLSRIEGPIQLELLSATDELFQAVSAFNVQPSAETAARINELRSSLKQKQSDVTGAVGRLEETRGERQGNVLTEQPTEVVKGIDRLSELGLSDAGIADDVTVVLKSSGVPTLDEVNVDLGTQDIKDGVLSQADAAVQDVMSFKGDNVETIDFEGIYASIGTISVDSGVDKKDLLKAALRISKLAGVSLEAEGGGLNTLVGENINKALKIMDEFAGSGVEVSPVGTMNAANEMVGEADNRLERLGEVLKNSSLVRDRILQKTGFEGVV